MTDNEKELVRHRSSRHHRKRPWWWMYRLEMFALIALFAGVALVLGSGGHRERLTGFVSESLETFLSGIARLDSAVGMWVSQVTLSDIIGVALVAGALLLILWRIRERALRDPALTTLACPRCGATLHRIQRTWYDRLIDKVMTVRRYRCDNSECRWKGLRLGHDRTSGKARTTVVATK